MRWILLFLMLLITQEVKAQTPELTQLCTIFVTNASPFEVEAGARLQETGEVAYLGSMMPESHVDVMVPCNMVTEIMGVAPEGMAFESSNRNTTVILVRFTSADDPVEHMNHTVVLIR